MANKTSIAIEIIQKPARANNVNDNLVTSTIAKNATSNTVLIGEN